MTRSKRDWRQRLLEARHGIDPAVRRAGSAAIVERLHALPEFAAATVVASYVPRDSEVDVAELLAFTGGHVVTYHPGGNAAGPRWVPARVPADGPPMALSCAELARQAQGTLFLVVPGVGFDERGVRLGRGGGYYDRALASLRSTDRLLAVGVAFDAQVVTSLPSDAWDQRVDMIATERRLIILGTRRDSRDEGSPEQEVRKPCQT